jgi:hypothetical protein
LSHFLFSPIHFLPGPWPRPLFATTFRFRSDSDSKSRDVIF